MKKIILGSVIVTLAATPWVNSDALIIPKIIVLTCLALYILPELSLNLKNKLDNKMMIIIITLSLLFILQMVIVMLVSEAPFEQEFFGRTGRGLGFLTYFSLILIFLYTVLKIKLLDISKIFQGILISCFFIIRIFNISIFRFGFFRLEIPN